MTKLTKKYDPYSDHIQKRTSNSKRGLERCPRKDNNHPKQHVTTLEASVTITLQLCRELQQC